MCTHYLAFIIIQVSPCAALRILMSSDLEDDLSRITILLHCILLFYFIVLLFCFGKPVKVLCKARCVQVTDGSMCWITPTRSI